MPVHNGSRWLDDSLTSVLAQTFTGSLELSAYNDASNVSHNATTVNYSIDHIGDYNTILIVCVFIIQLGLQFAVVAIGFHFEHLEVVAGLSGTGRY